MTTGLTDTQRDNQAAFRAFADSHVRPFADTFDRAEQLPRELIAQLAATNWLAAGFREADGGLDPISFGLLNEEIGAACSSVRSLLTVQAMVGSALGRWATREQQDQWLPRLRDGTAIGSFCLTEPNVGSDGKSVETAARRRGTEYVLDGHKKWISFGQIADVLLVIARVDDRPTAFLVDRQSPGIDIVPIRGLLGVRATMLAEVMFTECRVPADAVVGRVGLGFSHVATSALDVGRYSIAWGCVGIAQAALDAALQYAGSRRQFGVVLGEHQLVRRLLTRAIADVRAARLLCLNAARYRQEGDPAGVLETLIAKYFASNVASRIASDAVQIHGAVGVSREAVVERLMRDAKIMEIVEGSTQIQELLISRDVLQTAMAEATVEQAVG
jgi:glutaryl-CoA dehydrogenase (non-decarboxylating)